MIKERLLFGCFFFLLSLVITGNIAMAQEEKDTTLNSTDDPLATELTSNLSETDTYVWPKDPKVLENLKKWRGYKFGLLIHMGLYS
ncbi:MAG TPA: hypothetical protein VLA03_10025, partial [Draconibacterium sp.]|nr:hypothetical protein [Draconibacterium sp.]